jgi:hypothetical protein
VNTRSLTILNLECQKFPLFKHVQTAKKAGDIKSWDVLIPGRKNNLVAGRICIIRKSNEAIKMAQNKIIRTANKRSRSLLQGKRM